MQTTQNLGDQTSLLVNVLIFSVGCMANPGCASTALDGLEGLATGRISVILTGETSRRYVPQVRFVEIEAQLTHDRFRIELTSEDRQFAIHLPAGEYRITRVQISEGPFMSMARLDSTFSVQARGVTYLGTWRFGVESPRYGRMLAVSMVMTEDDETDADVFLSKEYPLLRDLSRVASVPDPSQIETRLYEVAPYPRYPTYFRRHLW